MPHGRGVGLAARETGEGSSSSSCAIARCVAKAAARIKVVAIYSFGVAGRSGFAALAMGSPTCTASAVPCVHAIDNRMPKSAVNQLFSE